MRFIGLVSLLLVLVVSACSQSREIKKLNGETIREAEVDRVVGELMAAAHVTGLCLAVLNDDEVVYRKAFGFRNRETEEPLDENSILLGASFSKVVFGYVVMQLVQENVLDLDEPLFTYLDKPLPEFDPYKDLAGDDRWKRFTIRQCLSHTTGLPNIRGGKLEIYFEPGTRYAYSGEGIRLMQLVVEHVTNRGLEELAEERVFRPLGMTRTSFLWRDRFEDDFAVGHDVLETPTEYWRWDDANGGGSLLTTITDYTRFVRAVMQGRGLEESTRSAILSPSIRIRSEHQFPTLVGDTTDKYDSIELSYGLGWGLFTCEYGNAFFKEGHGNGWQNYNVNFVDRGTSIIIMTNSDNGEKIFKYLLERVIGDTFTPWEWEGYVPYDQVKPVPIGVYLYEVILMQDIDKAVETYRRIDASPMRSGFVFDESQLNDLGYQMIKENKLPEAVRLFELNVEQYPESANAYDSLGEGYMRSGENALAIENYERSLALDPQNDNAREMLKRLKAGGRG